MFFFVVGGFVWIFDFDLLCWYDWLGLCYILYLIVFYFYDGFDVLVLCQVIVDSNQLVCVLLLYVYVLFCFSFCFYCGCNWVIICDRGCGYSYVVCVLVEVDLLVLQFEDGCEVIQLYLGGGMLNFFEVEVMIMLVEGLCWCFDFSDLLQCDFLIEFDLCFIDICDVVMLVWLGFNCVSLGVQDFDLQVQEVINCVQGVQQMLDILQVCCDSGMCLVNVDLIYGLLGQSLEGFGCILEWVLVLCLDCLVVYGYVYLLYLFCVQKQIDECCLFLLEDKLVLLGLVVEKFFVVGYQYIGMDYFVLLEEDLLCVQCVGQLYCNFMGYIIYVDIDLFGLGVSVISYIGVIYSQNLCDLFLWEDVVDQGQLLVWCGVVFSVDDQLCVELIQQLMCQGEVDGVVLGQCYGVDFEQYFVEDLCLVQWLQEDGLVEYCDGVVCVSEFGWLLLWLLVMCFDLYLCVVCEQLCYLCVI